MHVHSKRVVTPRDVAQRALDDPVVRRVDDALIRPRRRRMRSRRANQDAELLCLNCQLHTPIDDHARRLIEVLAAPGLDFNF